MKRTRWVAILVAMIMLAGALPFGIAEDEVAWRNLVTEGFTLLSETKWQVWINSIDYVFVVSKNKAIFPSTRRISRMITSAKCIFRGNSI